MIKKKCLGGPDNGGTYYTLAERAGSSAEVGGWRSVAAEAVDEPNGSVRLRIRLAGRIMLVARDHGIGCAPLRGQGRVGIRGDNAEFLFRSFEVHDLL